MADLARKSRRQQEQPTGEIDEQNPAAMRDRRIAELVLVVETATQEIKRLLEADVNLPGRADTLGDVVLPRRRQEETQWCAEENHYQCTNQDNMEGNGELKSATEQRAIESVQRLIRKRKPG